MDDNKFESTQSGIVDLAFGLGVECLNVQGIYKTEKLSKMIRYAEILQ